MSIESQLRAIQLKTKNVAKEVFISSGIRVGNQIITGSPWDKGTFKNSWNTEQNGISYSKDKPDNKSGSDAMAELRVEFSASDIGDFVTFNNPQPYGNRLEYDGWSDMAKNGFVRINTAKWAEIVNEEVLKRR